MAGAGEAEERIAGADLSGAGAGWGARLHAWKGNGERIQLGPASTETVRALCTGTRWPSLLDLPLPTFLRAHVVDGASQRGPGKLFGSFLYPSCASQCAGIAAKASSLVPPSAVLACGCVPVPWVEDPALISCSASLQTPLLTATVHPDPVLCALVVIKAAQDGFWPSSLPQQCHGNWGHVLGSGTSCPRVAAVPASAPGSAQGWLTFFFFACGVLFLAGKKKSPNNQPLKTNARKVFVKRKKKIKIST